MGRGEILKLKGTARFLGGCLVPNAARIVPLVLQAKNFEGSAPLCRLKVVHPKGAGSSLGHTVRFRLPFVAEERLVFTRAYKRRQPGAKPGTEHFPGVFCLR